MQKISYTYFQLILLLKIYDFSFEAELKKMCNNKQNTQIKNKTYHKKTVLVFIKTKLKSGALFIVQALNFCFYFAQRGLILR